MVPGCLTQGISSSESSGGGGAKNSMESEDLSNSECSDAGGEVGPELVVGWAW